MSICIRFSAASDHIRRSDWEAAFEDALQIARKGQLCGVEQRSYEGHTYNAGIPVGEDEFCRTDGLEVSGELQSGSMMEPHFIPRSFGVDEPKENGNESILALYLDEYAPHGIIEPETVDILHNKTQGTASHIWLLAMVCVFCDRFPDAASVMGEVTASQVGRALQIAEDVLGRRLLPPLAYDMDRLLARIRSLKDVDEVAAAKLFFRIYCGPENEAFVEFVVRSFSADAVYAAFRNAANQRGINGILMNWLLLDKPFEDVCRIQSKHPCFAPEDFVRVVLEEKVHIRENADDDTAFPDRRNEPLDEIGLLLLRVYIKMFGLRASAVERFIPLEQIKASSTDAFGAPRDVDEPFTAYARMPVPDDRWKAEEEFRKRIENAMEKIVNKRRRK